MNQDKIDILQRAIKREKAARKAAESILESKSSELYYLTEELKKVNTKLGELLDEKSSELQGVFENILDAYLVIELSGNVIKMNAAAVDLFGYDIQNQKLNVTDLIYKEDLKHAFESFNQLNEKGFFTNYTSRIISKDNTIKWVQVNGSLIFNSQKKPIAAQGIVRDITIDKEAEDALIESENRLSSLILSLDNGVLLENEKREIVLTNNKFCEIFKIPVSPELLKGQDCSNASEQSKGLFKDPESFINRINEILKNKEQVLGDELLMIDGTILERDFIPILKGNEYKGHLWTYKNVTLRRQYRKSLETQKEKYSSIIANMNLGLVEVNTEDEILMINQSFSEMSGYSEEELIGKKGGEVFQINEEEDVISKQNLKRIKGESNSYEIKVKNKKGETRNWLISGAPNYNLKGELVGSIGIHLDITDFKALENQKENILKELEKRNDELQEYAHVVSHDLKSPLRSIDALVSWIKMDNKDKLDEASIQNLELIENTLETMEQLISNILEYSSAGSEVNELEFIDLNLLFNKIKGLLLIPENTSVYALKKLPTLKGDATKFQQLFQNLISNALKFLDKEKGIVEVDYTEENSFYKFSIKDNGIGIEKKYHEKIFKIFQSLNKREDSTGIGLSIVKKIVDLYGGTIWLESEPNVGTTFYFTIKK